MENLSNKIKNAKTPISSLEMIDYVISIQLDKIETYYNDPRNKKITDKSESAMENLVELLKIRGSIANRINLFE